MRMRDSDQTLNDLIASLEARRWILSILVVSQFVLREYSLRAGVRELFHRP